MSASAASQNASAALLQSNKINQDSWNVVTKKHHNRGGKNHGGGNKNKPYRDSRSTSGERNSPVNEPTVRLLPALLRQKEHRAKFKPATYDTHVNGVKFVTNDNMLYFTYVESKEVVESLVKQLIAEAIEVIRSKDANVNLDYSVRVNWVLFNGGIEIHHRFAVVDIDNNFIVRTILNKNLDGTARFNVTRQDISDEEEEMDFSAGPVWGNSGSLFSNDTGSRSESPDSSLQSSGSFRSWADLSGDTLVSRVESQPLVNLSGLNDKVDAFSVKEPKEEEAYQTVKVSGLPYDNINKILDIYARYARYGSDDQYPRVKVFPDTHNTEKFSANVTYETHYDAAFAMAMCRKMYIKHQGLGYQVYTNPP